MGISPWIEGSVIQDGETMAAPSDHVITTLAKGSSLKVAIKNSLRSLELFIIADNRCRGTAQGYSNWDDDTFLRRILDWYNFRRRSIQFLKRLTLYPAHTLSACVGTRSFSMWTSLVYVSWYQKKMNLLWKFSGCCTIEQSCTIAHQSHEISRKAARK